MAMILKIHNLMRQPYQRMLIKASSPDFIQLCQTLEIQFRVMDILQFNNDPVFASL